MTVGRRILLMEYLLADPGAWNSAGSSLRAEASAMMTALLCDVQQLSGWHPHVLLSSEAAQRLGSTGLIAAHTQVIICDQGPFAWLAAPTILPQLFKATLVIAPESDGILVSLLKLFQQGLWSQASSINLTWQLAEVFADKFRTFEWLCERGICTPDTRTIDDAEREQILSLSASVSGKTRAMNDQEVAAPDSAVLKPRDGCGSESVLLVSAPASCFNPNRARGGKTQVSRLRDRWILQPPISGIACSVGFLGAGYGRPPLILPPAQQDIRLEQGAFRYFGGTIPCREDLRAVLRDTASVLAEALGAFSGYVGADVIVSRESSGLFRASVIEVNPRLCTSYTGYRVLCRDNLAEWLLLDTTRHELSWKPEPVRFGRNGTAELPSEVAAPDRTPHDRPDCV